MNLTNHHYVGAEYLRGTTMALVALADEACELLTPHKDRFDTFVCTGLSGTILTPLLSIMMDIPFAVIRKENENNHSGYPIEGMMGKRCLFVDDFIASGSTYRRVCAAVSDQGSKVIGQYLYETSDKVRIS